MTVLPAPRLSDDRIKDVLVGLRPCRTGGMRLEAERLAHADRVLRIVHNYGQGGCGLTLGFGCAQVAADLVQQVLGEQQPTVPPMVGPNTQASPGRRPRVAVLGAGVIGLTTARELAARGFGVSLHAREHGVSTTSGIAGGLWLPTGIEFGTTPAQRGRFHDVLHRSHDTFQRIDRTRFRVVRLPVYEPADAPYEPQFFDNGTVAPPKPLDRLPLAGPARAGRVFFTDFIHTHGFLSALWQDVRDAGVRFVEQSFESLDDVAALDADVSVNCLGLGARTLFGDERLYPARGILVLMEPEPLEYIVHDGYKYLFPREDALILGGCFQPNVDDCTPDQAIVDEILNHHRAFFSDHAATAASPV